MQFTAPHQLPDMAAAAHAYVAIGLAVLPLPPHKKYPPPSGWQDNIARYRDPAFIARYWQQNPTASIGLPMAANGLLAIDLDRHNHNGSDCPASCTADGLDWLERMKQEQPYPWYEAAIMQRTGSGGVQLIFAFPRYIAPAAIASVKGCAAKLAPHVDLIHGNRYIVVSPSTHPNGNPYCWAETQRPFDFLAASGLDADWLSCPGWLWAMLEELQKPRLPLQAMQQATAHPRIIAPTNPAAEQKRKQAQAEATMLGAIDDLVRCTPGTRNDTLNAKAWQLGRLAADAGWDYGQIWQALETGWAALGKPTGEGRATIASGLNDGLSNPRPLPPARPQAPKIPTLITRDQTAVTKEARA